MVCQHLRDSQKGTAATIFLRVLRKNNPECNLMVTFYRTTIESVLTYCISAWHSGCTSADKRVLQRVINTAQKNHWLLTALPGIHCPLPLPNHLKRLLSPRPPPVYSPALRQ